MKKIFVLALSALMVAAFSGAAMAKVNLSGAIWVTYWAQQEGQVNYQVSRGLDAGWSDVTVLGVAPNVPAITTGAWGRAGQASKKTFLLGQSMSGNGTSAKNPAGDGFLLALDCPVNDWVKAYGEVDVLPGATTLFLQQGYINLAFMKELNVRTGLMEVPFGHEHMTRPTVGQDEVFVSDFSQSANAALQRRYDVGIQALGTLASGMVDYNVYMGNGALPTVANTSVTGAGATAANATLGGQTVDDNDAKQLGVNLCFKPFTGAFVGGSYFAGDYSTTLLDPNNPVMRAKATSYDINAGYEYANIFEISAEYARTRHDKMSLAYQLGLPPIPANMTVQNKVNEYILKVVYTGVVDWEFGARYGVVDPANIEAEIAAGYAMEKKVSFAAGYKFARAAFLKGEYSWLRTNNGYTNALRSTAALNSRQNPTQDVQDDIFALSLGLQF